MMMVIVIWGPRLVRQHVRKMRICGEIIYNHKARDTHTVVVVCCHGCRCEAIAQGGGIHHAELDGECYPAKKDQAVVGLGTESCLMTRKTITTTISSTLFPSNVCVVVCFCC